MLTDSEIKNKLNNFSSPVSEKVWERIVNEQQKNKLLIHSYFTGARLFFFVGLLFILSLVGLFIFNEGNRNSFSNNTKNISFAANDNVNFKENVISKKNLFFFDKPLFSTATNTQKHTVITKENVATPNQSAVVNLHNNKNFTTESELNEAAISVNNPVYDGSNEIITNANNNEINSNTSVDKIKDETIGLEKGNIEQIFLNTSNPLKQISANKISKLSYKSVTPPIECPGDYNTYKKNWYVEGFIAPEYVTKKVFSNHTNDAYLMKKDSVENMLFGVTAGVKFTKGLSNNLYLKGGLQYSQLIEKMNLLQEKERKEITVITIKTETDINGNTITKSDTTKQIQILYANSTKYSSYKNIELPISLGYEFYRRGFRASVNAGVIVNLSSWYSGKILDTNYQFISIKEKPGIYKQNVGFSLYGSISLIKPLSETAEIFAEPYFRYSLNNPKYNSYGFKQKFNAVGLALGLRFKLNKQSIGRTFH
jgi:hypothetical protein